MANNYNSVIIPISLPKQLSRELDRVARKEKMTRSEFVRDSLRRRLAFAGLNEFREVFAKRARKAGIRTLRDAVRIAREVRHGKASKTNSR